MKIKYYKVTSDDILKWWFSLKDGDCSKIMHSPLEIIDDLKTGKQEWYYMGVPMKLVPRKQNPLKARICEKS